MPNHYHARLTISDFRTFGKALGKVHGRSAHYANQRDGTPGRQLWYKYADRALRGQRHYWTCLHYLFENPVKHESAERMKDWLWSSYHESLREHAAARIADLQREYPLREFGRDWDDWRLHSSSQTCS